ncbi:MAG: lycopene cyclase domain-containing protein [Patescibacteria group bacterium]
MRAFCIDVVKRYNQQVEYLAGIAMMAIVWLFFFLLRKDIRKEIVWGGYYYLSILSLGFILIKIFAPDIPAQMTITPGYWNPNTLFDLARITGGYSLEDALYMFFTGGIAVAIYETLFRKHIGHRQLRHRPHFALIIGGFAGIIVAALGVNLIYVLIAFGFAGAITTWLQRPDLIKHSILGGISYLLVYIFSFLLFLEVFPEYVTTYYSLQNISGILLLGIPLEELAFAFGFGLMWSPIYEYVKDVR